MTNPQKKLTCRHSPATPELPLFFFCFFCGKDSLKEERSVKNAVSCSFLVLGSWSPGPYICKTLPTS